MVRVGIVGLGYWGPNLARALARVPGTTLAAICDLNRERLDHVRAHFPTAYATRNLDDLLAHQPLDALVIATPTKSHYALARTALELGLHTFVEKPLATSPHDCESLIRLAEDKGVALFVGHVFLYAAAVSKLKDLIVRGELGRLCYISSERLNLGPVRQDVNALWDLASHDISIILHLMGAAPVSVNCQGLAFLNARVHDVCSLSLQFASNSMATVHVSWLHPRKKRELTVVGEKKMAVYDDIEPLEKLKIYDNGIELPTYSDSFAEFQYSYRYGDTYSPRLAEVEPLLAECRHFIECTRERKRPKTDGWNGLEAVRVLQAAEQSLLNGGGRVRVEQGPTPPRNVGADSSGSRL
jgi:predicted dehydrogenase